MIKRRDVEQIVVTVAPRWVRVYDIETDRTYDGEATEMELHIVESDQPLWKFGGVKLGENLYLAAKLRVKESEPYMAGIS